MVQRLEPLRVIIVGRMPQELQTDIEIINFKSRNQKIKDREGKYGILNWTISAQQSTQKKRQDRAEGESPETTDHIQNEEHG